MNLHLLPRLIMRPLPADLRAELPSLAALLLLGLAAGLLGSLFFVATEVAQWALLEQLVGYRPLRALGETFEAVHGQPRPDYRPWLLPIVTGLGGLVGGLICTLAPETQGGGGGNAMIADYHRDGAPMRLRVLGVRALASTIVLGSGGSGGREGPTMQMGGVLGAAIARLFRLKPSQRRILYLAGVAAGIAAVFRTPLGAALLAVEIVYHDDFAADALVPAILASVVAYATAVALLGDSTLFGPLPRFRVEMRHLPLFACMAVILSGVAALFASLLHRTHKAFESLPGPVWLRPALGGLLLGLFCLPILAYAGTNGQGMGLLGPSYGAAQLAITGATWLAPGWGQVRVLVLLAVLKMVASLLTVGSGASTGDFAPSLIIGALAGSAFGHAATLLLDEPSLQPGAFALVGMATFYGGLAHVPLTILVMVCELAGSYELLVPLMLAGGIAVVLLRRQSLYPAQAPSQHHVWEQRARAAEPGGEAATPKMDGD